MKIFLIFLLGIFLSTNSMTYAYDLPRLKPNKKIVRHINPADKKDKMPIIKSDWKSAEIFKEQLRQRLANGEIIPVDDPTRSPLDKNFVFIAFYNDAPFFLDKYSLKILVNEDDRKVWRQRIFPISKNYSPTNTTSTEQIFCLQDGKFFNSSKARNPIENIKNDIDQKFLQECFNIGYYFAFGSKISE